MRPNTSKQAAFRPTGTVKRRRPPAQHKQTSSILAHWIRLLSPNTNHIIAGRVAVEPAWEWERRKKGDGGRRHGRADSRARASSEQCRHSSPRSRLSPAASAPSRPSSPLPHGGLVGGSRHAAVHCKLHCHRRSGSSTTSRHGNFRGSAPRPTADTSSS